jgi:hypothetical protein
MEGMKRLYQSMAKTSAMRKHAQACDAAIRRRADAWAPAVNEALKKHRVSPEAVLEPGYDELGALKILQDSDNLRRIRDS